MLRVLPDWWMTFMLWLDNTTIPMWLVGVVVLLVLARAITTLATDLDTLSRRRE